MKTLNTIIISGLLTFSWNAMTSAAEFEKQNLEMNRVLQERIDAQILRADRTVDQALQARAVRKAKQNTLSVAVDRNSLATRS